MIVYSGKVWDTFCKLGWIIGLKKCIRKNLAFDTVFGHQIELKQVRSITNQIIFLIWILIHLDSSFLFWIKLFNHFDLTVFDIIHLFWGIMLKYSFQFVLLCFVLRFKSYSVWVILIRFKKQNSKKWILKSPIRLA